MKKEKSKNVVFLEADLIRLGVPLEGLDLSWIANVRAETEDVIVELRNDPRFAEALPATAVWQELQWSEKNT